MAAIPLDMMLWLAAGIFGLGVFFLVPIWWRNWRVSRGADLPVTEFDLNGQVLARLFLTLGTMMAIGAGLTMASQALPLPLFLALCGGGTLALIAIALAVDARHARRHR